MRLTPMATDSGMPSRNRPYGDRRRGSSRLLAARALAVLAPDVAHRPVRAEEGHSPQQDAARSRVKAPHQVGFLHQLEGHRRDEHARACGCDDGDHPLGNANVEAYERAYKEGCAPDETPEPRRQCVHAVSLRSALFEESYHFRSALGENKCLLRLGPGYGGVPGECLSHPYLLLGMRGRYNLA